jgi:hypothetical protein
MVKIKINIPDQNKKKYTKTEKQFIEKDFKKMCVGYEYTPSILPACDRIVVYGDIHGDLKLTIDFLTQSHVATYDYGTKKATWTGGRTHCVQVGDQVDRCRFTNNDKTCNDPNTTQNDEANDIVIMEIFNDLSIQAKKVGGAVISLLGNHELLNAMGHMEYVSYLGIKQFDDYIDPENPSKKYVNGHEARIHAFKPGNEYGKMMGCTRYPAVIIGSHLFVHAGIIDALIEEISIKNINDIEKINIKIKRWLLGLLSQKYVDDIVQYSENSMFWSRLLGRIPPNTPMTDHICLDNIQNVLKLFKAKSIIVGHTPQSFIENSDLNSTCGKKVWRVDTGSSSAFDIWDPNGKYSHRRRTQYLEIINDEHFFICDSIGCKKEVY